jgi:hypothetical protein
MEPNADVQRGITARLQAILPHDCTLSAAIRVHYCHYCHELLAVCEIVQAPNETSLPDTCQSRAPSVAERMGDYLQVPVYQITFTGTPVRLAAVGQVGHTKIVLMKPDELGQFIDKLHDCEHCKRHEAGRFAPEVHNRSQE